MPTHPRYIRYLPACSSWQIQRSGRSSSKSLQKEDIGSYADALFTVNAERLTQCVGFQAFVMDEYLCFSGAVVKQEESNPISSPSLKK